MTKPIIVVKMPSCKLLYIIQVKGSWLYLISKVLVTCVYKTIATMLLLIGLALFYSQAAFVCTCVVLNM